MQQQQVNPISISGFEFQYLVHYLESGSIDGTLYLTPNALQVLTYIEQYETANKKLPPIGFLEQLTGQILNRDYFYELDFVKERIKLDYIEREVKTITDEGTRAADRDPLYALERIRDFSQDLYMRIRQAEDKDETLFFSDYEKRLNDLLLTDPNNPDKDSTIFKTRCYFGLPTIDRSTQGLCEGDFALIFGQTNQGKSWFAKKIATHVVTKQHKRVLLLTFEEEANVAMHTIDSLYATIDSTQYMNRTLDSMGRIKLQQAFEGLKQGCGELIIPPVEKMKRGSISEILTLVRLYNVDLVVIDQLTFTARSLGWEDMAEYARMIKTAARTLRIPFLGISQGKKDAKPIWDVGYEAVAHGEELPRTADTVVYVGNSNDSVEYGVKLAKLIKSRKGAKDIIIQLRWDLGTSLIEEIGEFTGPVPDTRRGGRRRNNDDQQPSHSNTQQPEQAESCRNRPIFSWGT